MKLTSTRTDLVELLRLYLPADMPIVDYVADQFAQPAVLVAWGTPWLEPATLCGGWTARIDLYLIASRFEAGGSWSVIESLVEQISDALDGSNTFAHDLLGGPSSWEISGATYLAARWTVTAEIGE